ncbi:hypothetical protein PV08_02949 [Exophiala spinifera]|uniref:Uncharacterized protein n=1 Tax=Exophiala spinifera TaxID=91928 RepID=A0A0D2BJ99_9EURO|nr:uncharacterized protein PV08_02949 [Exophiala spinifera]KIW18660.1 hypothetical protein PV08_02949 [Exophiala spinifera]
MESAFTSPSPESCPPRRSRLEAKDEMDIDDPVSKADKNLDSDDADKDTAEHHAISHTEELRVEDSLKMEEHGFNGATPSYRLKLDSRINVCRYSMDSTPNPGPQCIRTSSSAKSSHPKLRLQAKSLKASVPDLQPAWLQYAARRIMQNETLEELLNKPSGVPPVAPTLEDNSCSNWQPFDMTMFQDTLREAIDDARSLSGILEPSANIMLSKQMLWKRPGLLLQESGDYSDFRMDVDNELNQETPVEFLSQVPQKRIALDSIHDVRPPMKRLLLDLETRPTTPPRRHFKPNRGRLKELIESQVGIPSSSVTMAAQNEVDTHGASRFSAANSLRTFLDLRGNKFKKTSFVEDSDKQQISDDPIRSTSSESSDSIKISLQTEIRAVPREQVPGTLMLASLTDMANMFLKNDMLTFEKFDPPRSIIVNTGMLRKDRCLITSLETHAEDSLSMIYRDMDSPDVILNPRACLVFTNLQALSQRSLPGQQGSAKEGLVQSIVSRLVRDFEITFVFVAMPDTGGSVSRNVQDAMNNFTGFCMTKSDRDANVCPIWVLTNTETNDTGDDLQSWVWRLIHQHAFVTAQLNDFAFIHEESIGELFFQRLGLNPMAAQVALHVLESPETTSAQVSRSWGLRELARLRTEGRMDLLREVLGLKTVRKLTSVLETTQYHLS